MQQSGARRGGGDEAESRRWCPGECARAGVGKMHARGGRKAAGGFDASEGGILVYFYGLGCVVRVAVDLFYVFG